MTHVVRLVGWLKHCDLSLSLRKQAFSHACSLSLLTDWVCMEHTQDSADILCLESSISVQTRVPCGHIPL